MDGKQVELKKVYESQSGREKTVVLWVSRHPPLRLQVEELEERLRNIVIYQLSGVIPNAEFVVQKAREVNARYIVPVLPLSMIARLVELSKNSEFIVLWAKMIAVGMYDREPQPHKDYDPRKEVYIKVDEENYRIMRFEGFYRLRAVRLELEPF